MIRPLCSLAAPVASLAAPAAAPCPFPAPASTPLSAKNALANHPLNYGAIAGDSLSDDAALAAFNSSTAGELVYQQAFGT